MPPFDPPPFDPAEGYALHPGGGVVRASDGMVIPEDPDNRLWGQFRAWRDAGHEPSPAAEVAPPVSGDAILGAIPKADRSKLDPVDVVRLAWRPDVPASNAKLARVATALGTTPAALIAAAKGAP